MTKYLVPGRWQVLPPHNGHIALINELLGGGHEVTVAVRDTNLSESNPYTVLERVEAIRAIYGDQVKIISVPDFDLIAYGRGVGWGFEEIKLPDAIEEISATEIRSTDEWPIIWLTGHSGAGKSTTANWLKSRLRAIVLDGDEMRASISEGMPDPFSHDSRMAHNLRVARLARELCRQRPILVAVIAPTHEIRGRIEGIVKPTWVYVERQLPERPNHIYEKPNAPAITINTDNMDVGEAGAHILIELRKQNLFLGLG